MNFEFIISWQQKMLDACPHKQDIYLKLFWAVMNSLAYVAMVRIKSYLGDFFYAESLGLGK